MLITSSLLRYVEDRPLDDQYRWLHKTWTSDRYTILSSWSCISPLDYKYNPELNRWLCWVNKNIILNLANDHSQTIMVRLRIATGMLNKLESLTKLEKIQIHNNLTLNVNLELNKVIEASLPF